MANQQMPSEEELAAFTAVSVATMAAAREAWQRHIKDKRLAAFLYRLEASGRQGSQVKLGRAGMETVLAAYVQEARGVASAYQSGATLPTFAAGMGKIITEVHAVATLASVAAVVRELGLGAADIADMSIESMILLEEEVHDQREYFSLWIFALSTGTAFLDGRLLQRAGLYAKAGLGSYYRNLSWLLGQRGFTEERRLLGVAEHCPDCVEYAARGWQPIGTLPQIGDSRCMTNCKCEFEYR